MQGDSQPLQAGSALRLLLLVFLVTAASAAMWKLARIDAGVGPAAGPDRIVARYDSRAGDAASARQAAFAVLHDRPMEGAAFRWLAAAADAAGDDARASALYAAALRLKPRDIGARAWLLERCLDRGDMLQAADHLDALLRTSPDAGRPQLQMVMARTSDRQLRAALVGVLAEDPPWRDLLPSVLASDSEPARAEALLGDLSSRGLRTAELSLRASLLQSMGRPGQARATWSRGLSREQKQFDGRIFDAGFELGPGPEPYGWRFETSPEVLVGLDASHAAQGRSSLLLILPDRAVQFSGVSQQLTLPPGRYVLQVQADIALVGSGRPFAWLLTCGNGEQRLAHLALPKRTAGWQLFSLAFEVEGGCPTQTLKLVHEGRNLAERTLSGQIAIDAMTLRRVPG